MKTHSFLALLTLAVSSALAADPDVSSPLSGTRVPAADHMVYLNELPESADLMANAATNGLTVKRLDRTSDRVVITYGYPDGTTATMGYALLSAAGGRERDLNPGRETRVVERRSVRVVTPEPEIVYYEPRYPRTRYVYRDRVDDFWLPLTLGVGLGWATGHHNHHGHYRGHYSSGHHYRGHHGHYRGHHGRGHHGGGHHRGRR